MREYTTTGPINVFCGYIGLSESQAKARMKKLKATEKPGVYEVVAPVMFKAGESLMMDNPDKITKASLDEVKKGDAEPEKPKKAKK